MTLDSTEVSPRVLIAADSDAGARLDVFVARELQVSRERAKKLLDGATINGVAAKSSHVLKAGDEVCLNIEHRTSNVQRSTQLVPHHSPLVPVLFEDESIIVVNKPRGLVVHEGAGEEGSTLVEILRAQGKELSTVGPFERAGIVHRLDKDTSGVLVVCKTDAAHWKLTEDFAERRVNKEYAALVCGVPRAAGRIEAPIARHPVYRKRMAVAANGRPATTEYSVEKSWAKFAFLKVKILTGRTHQIRVHFQYLNHPVVGDAVYGGLKRALENAPDVMAKTAIENLNGQALHAARLEFTHPISGEAIFFEAPVPGEMQRVINALSQK